MKQTSKTVGIVRTLSATATATLWLAGATGGWTAEPPMGTQALIEVRGDEQRRINMQLPDGGLKPVVGVQNVQVFRACSGKPGIADGDGWTYAHHQDLAVWKGRLYAAWAMSPKDEDVPPNKVVYATSTNGLDWSAPTDLFPRDLAWATRFYFYRASNGRMLALSAAKPESGEVTEADKKVLLVREITADHHLGKVFTLVCPVPGQPPSFETATDAGFVAACHEAVGNNLLLEQQDYGVFLGDRRMPWHANPDLNKVGFWKFGKALCFYHRQDGALVGLSKMGYATLSEDAGKIWSKPVQPTSLLAGSGKIWGQKTADGRFALAYNPDPGRGTRYPLAIVHGEDGREFRDMRVVQGELPRLRYPGKYKGLGAQYMRGLAEWADDGTFADKQAMWLVYSMNKEDIWVARIPLPIKVDETEFVTDDFARTTPGAVVPGWNLYSPKWAPVSIVESAGKRNLELRDGDPFDYARAVRVFPESAKIRAELDLTPAQANARLEIELCDAASHRPIRVMLTETGLLQAADGKNVVELGKYTAGEKLSVIIASDMAASSYTVQVNGGEARKLAIAEAATTLQRLSLRTGVWRGLGDGGAVNATADVPPATPAVFQVQLVKIAYRIFAMNGLSADVSVVPKENNAYLLNPGKGWIIYSSFANASTAAWAKASVGYTRYMWKDIHTNDNQFNWSVIDNDLAECVKRGKRFAFGVMTVSVNSSTDRRGMPPWVADAGAKFLGNGDYKEPVWDDPVFTNKIGQFVAALIKRYNGNPNLEFIDCRTYGNWGEWHLCGCVGSKAPSEAILRQYLDQWRGFDQTQIIVPISGGTGMQAGGYGLYARDICQFGAREDSSETAGRWKTCLPFLNHGPVVAEWSFPYTALKQGKGWTKEIWSHDKLAGQINGSKYSYQPLGEWNGQDSDTFLQDAGPLVDEWQNKMGYWFKLTQASYPADLANGTTGKLSFRMRNDGVAPIYIKGHRAVVRVALMDNATNVLSTVTLKGVNPFDWKPGETIAQAVEFAFPKNAKGTKLALGVFTKESLAHPDIKLGIDNGTALNWYVLTDMARGVD